MKAPAFLRRFLRPAVDQMTFNELLRHIALSNPAVAEALRSGRGFGFDQGVKELDQDFDGYLRSVGLFDDFSTAVDRRGDAASARPVIIRNDAGETVPVAEAPEALRRFLTKPNEKQSFQEFWKALCQQYDYTGEAPIVGVTESGDFEFGESTAEFWVQLSSHIRPKFTRDARRSGFAGPATPELIGYTHENLPGLLYPPDALIVPVRPHPRDPIRGLAPLKELEWKLNWMWAAMQANKSYLANGAYPGLAVSSEVEPEPSMKEAFEEIFGSKEKGGNTGVKNIGSTVWVWGQMIKMSRLRDAPKDALQLETFELVQKSIRAKMATPPIVMSDVDNANRSNSLAQREMFYRDGVVPLNRALLKAIECSAIVPEGWTLEHDYSDVEALQAGNKEKTESAVAAWKSGLTTKNEGRAALGLPPVGEDEGGEEFFTQMNPLDGIMQSIASNGNGREGSAEVEEEEDEEALR